MDSELVKEYRGIREDYAYNPDIFNAEPDRVRIVKGIICNRLSVPDKTLILLYAEYRSYRKLGRRLGISHTTLRREIQRIRRIILNEYSKLNN